MEINWCKEYGERAIKFRRDTGAESHPVISKEKHPQQWRDWYAWYGFRGMTASQELMRDKAEKTVPAISPYDFDASFNPAYQAPNVPRHSWYEPPAEERIRMGFKMTLLSKAVDLKQVERLRIAAQNGMDDLIGLAQTWGIEVPEQLWPMRAAE